MRHRRSQSTITIVLRDNLVIVLVRLPFQHAWLCFVADDERHIYVGPVLFFAVYLDCRMISGGAKRMTHLEICSVDIGARIDDECASARAALDAQRVVGAGR